MVTAPLSRGEFDAIRRILIDRQRAIDELLSVCCHSISEAQGRPRLVEAMEVARKALGDPPSDDHPEQLKHARHIADVAQREAEAGFPRLHEMATIVLWGAIQTAIKDFAVYRLVAHPELLSSERFGKIRVRVSEYETLGPIERMEFVVDQLERDLGATLKVGIGGLLAVLAAVGVEPVVDEGTRRTLHEMAAVRNVIVHRAGIADKRFVTLCPWLGVAEGQGVLVTRDTYLRYRTAVGRFASSVIEEAHGRKISKTDNA